MNRPLRTRQRENSQTANLLAIDVGGANLKLADGQGLARSIPFPLWQRSGELAAVLSKILDEFPRTVRLAATMTGELADCYSTKAEGVSAIVAALQQATHAKLAVYATDGRFLEPAAAKEKPLLAAASNWHVLARYAARWLPGGTGLVLDIGSTTSDLIPVVDHQPITLGTTDPERLMHGELVYTGVVRSPLCAVVRELPWRGRMCPVAQELFATVLDAYLLLGRIAEDANTVQTADGRPATLAAAHDRLARSVCADRTMFSREDALAAAQEVERAQLTLLTDAAERVLGGMSTRPQGVVVSGQGEFLARLLSARLRLDVPVVALSKQLGPELSQIGPAHALAVLAREQWQ